MVITNSYRFLRPQAFDCAEVTGNAPSVIGFYGDNSDRSNLAAVIYFWSDIRQFYEAWWRSLWWKRARQFDYKYGWAIIIGSIPIAIVGLCLSTKLKRFCQFVVCGVCGLVDWSVYVAG